MAWDLSCRDWEARLKSGRSLVPDLPQLDLVQGNRAVGIYNKLRLSDVPGTPTNAEAGGEWFTDIIRAMFGSWDPVARARAIAELFLLVPKKNNKTTGGALMMLTALLMNERPRAPFALMAPVQDTAEEAFNAVEGAILLDPVLDKKFHVRSHLKTIVHRETKADLQIMTFDPDILTGKKFVGTLIDELHVIAKNQKAAKALRQVRGGMLPFPEAFLAFITTMPDGVPVGVMKSELKKARETRDGTSTGRTLAVLYEYPVAMQQDKDIWLNPVNWPMVTPNLGRSVTMDGLIDLFNDAVEKGEEEIRGWASQHLNVEIGIALHGERWAGADFWEQQAVPCFTLAELLQRSDVVDIGIDGGGLDDLLGLAVIGRCTKTRKWLLWTHAWAHPSVFTRRKAVASTLEDFASDGDLTLVEKIGEDVAAVGAICAQCEASGKLDKIGCDPAGIGQILDALSEAGIPSEKVLGITQGWKMTGPVKTTERKLAEGVLVHGGQKLMAWCVGNAKPELKGNAILITKETAGSAKIDPLLATFNAVSLMSLHPAADKPTHQMFFC